MLKSLCAAIVISAVTSVAARANIVVDGDFNDPYAGSGFAANITTAFGGPSNNAWTVSGSVDLIGGYWQSPNGPGGGSVDLDGLFPGSISQVLNVTTPGLYNLSFALAGNPDGGSAIKTVYVSLATVDQTYNFTVTNSDNHNSMGYEQELLSNILLTGPATLTFASKDDANSPYGPVIGNVNVSPVPEASTWAMMIIGFLGVGFLAYRRSSTSALRFA